MICFRGDQALNAVHVADGPPCVPDSCSTVWAVFIVEDGNRGETLQAKVSL